jgi:hypothetical protein
VSYATFAAALFGFALCCYWSVRAWRSSPDSWRAFNQQLRTASWQRWPVYAALWRDFDRHTPRYLWLARFLAPASAALLATVSIVLIAELLRSG